MASPLALLLSDDEAGGDLGAEARIIRAQRILDAIEAGDAEALADALEPPMDEGDDLELEE